MQTDHHHGPGILREPPGSVGDVVTILTPVRSRTDEVMGVFVGELEVKCAP